MKATDVLRQDHRKVEELFTRFEQAELPQEKREVLDEIVRELSIHAAIEEEAFYPAAKEALPDGERLVTESLREHAEAKRLLAALDTANPEEPDFEEKVSTLKQDVEQHVEEEEGEVLPLFEEQVDEQILADLGAELESAKGRAPTRPHPHAPDEPPAIKAVGPVAAIVDRIRDRVAGRAGG